MQSDDKEAEVATMDQKAKRKGEVDVIDSQALKTPEEYRAIRKAEREAQSETKH